VATHVRNRPNLEKAADEGITFEYIDTEHITRAMVKISKFLRGGTDVA
jgi:hypothetical protein